MAERPITDLDSAIRERSGTIQRQRAYIEDFSARGYDMKAAHSMLSCLIMNLERLERQRHELTCQMDITVTSSLVDLPSMGSTAALASPAG